MDLNLPNMAVLGAWNINQALDELDVGAAGSGEWGQLGPGAPDTCGRDKQRAEASSGIVGKERSLLGGLGEHVETTRKPWCAEKKWESEQKRCCDLRLPCGPAWASNVGCRHRRLALVKRTQTRRGAWFQNRSFLSVFATKLQRAVTGGLTTTRSPQPTT